MVRAGRLLSLALLVGCESRLPGKPNPKDQPKLPDQVVAFDQLYRTNCAGCHGPDGKQGPAPPLNDPVFRTLVPAAEVERTITYGRPGTPMPPFAKSQGGTLTAAQLQILVNEIKGLPYRIDAKPSGEPTVTTLPAGQMKAEPWWGAVGPILPWDPPYLLPEEPGDARRGALLFKKACAGCHGENGMGQPQEGVAKRRINDQAFLALISDQELRRLMITGRQDLKMPNYAQKQGRPSDFQPLTSQDISDLGALLAAWRAGNSSLGAPAP